MIYSKKLNVELNKQGTDGKNAIVMTSATTPNGEYNGQVGIWQGQVYSWNGTDWVLTSGILPTDPVLHYSFDELPSIPDGTAITHLKGNTYNLWQKGFWGNNVQTVSNNNGNIHFVANGQYGGVVLNKSYIQGKSVVIVVKVISGKLFVDIQNKHGMYQELSQGTHTVKKYFSTSIENNLIFTTNGSDAIEFEIEEVYIGDASYTTPVIDNSGNNHNATDVKGLVTKGVSGKAIKKINGSDKITTNFSLSGDFSWSFWCRDYMTNTERTLYICSGRRVSDGAGDELTYVQKGTGKIEAGSASDYKLSAKSIYSFGDSIWHLYTTVRQGVNYLLYKDGIYQETITLSSVEDIKFLTVANRFSPYLEEQQIGYELDDFQIFNRALSDQEVLGLYLARGNTPKQFTLNDYRLNLIDDDGVISVSEKKELLSRWKEIYNAENVSSVLPTSNILSKGEYKAVIDSANSLSIGNITAITNYKESANALRDAFWGSNGYLVNMTTASTLSGNLDSLFANYKEALQNANNAISDQQSAQASAISVQMASPFIQLPINDSGSVTSYDNSGNVITVLNGAVTLTPVSATATLNDNQYSVTASGSDITAGGVSVDATNKKVTIGNSTALTKSNAQITYTIKFKINGTTGTLYAQQKISTASRGADGKRGPMYRGTTKPTTDVVNGDWYLDTSDNLIHVYNNSNWNNTVTDYDDYRYKPAINDMINLAATNPSVPFLSVTNAWIKNLAAGNILADEIATKDLVIGRKDENGNEQGTIQSANYVEGESGFLIKTDGMAEFNTGRFRGGFGKIVEPTSNYFDIKEKGICRITIFKKNQYDYEGFLVLDVLTNYKTATYSGKKVETIEINGEYYSEKLKIVTQKETNSTGGTFSYPRIEMKDTNDRITVCIEALFYQNEIGD